MFYEAILGIATLFFAMLLWTVGSHTMGIERDVFNNMTPTSRFNETVNQTAITGHYELAFNIFYIAFFFLAIVVFAWIIKKAQENQKNGIRR